ncbi:MAG: PASTA domain-containing protein [Ilumatobacteraceae bacterium]
MDERLIEGAELLGTVIAGRHHLLDIVSEGSTAIVFDAVRLDDDRPVTLKLVRPHLCSDPTLVASLPSVMQRSAAVVHPGVAAVFDWGIVELDAAGRLRSLPSAGRRCVFTVSESLDGGSLRDVFDRGRLLTPSQALQVGLEVCHGLADIHRHGLVHGELTPAKLLFGSDGRVRIADLGLAGLLNEVAWSDPSRLDNHVAAYAAPERVSGEAVSAAVDVYALSLILVEAMTGSVPFATDSTATTLSARVDRLLPVSADLGPLAPILEHAARPLAAERATAVEFGLALVAAAKRLPRPEALPLVVRPVPTSPSPDPTARAIDAVVDPSGELLIAPVDTPIAPPATARPTVEPVPVASDPPAGQPTVSPATATAPGPARSRPRWVVPTLAAVAVVVVGLVARWLLITPIHTVPDLAGTAEAEAMNLITPNGWVIERSVDRSDVHPEVGTVIRTSPAAGSELAEGAVFTLVVSEGPELRELPEVTGMVAGDAIALLTGAGFAPFPEETPNEVIPVGEVISWNVPGDATIGGGAMVEPGTAVRLLVSSGPAPRVVPDLVGQLVGLARAQLVADGLRIVEAEGVFSEEIPVGQILTQSPEPGATLARGEAVTITASLGPDVVTFPSLPDDIAFVDAQRLLIDAGFTVRLALGAADGTVVEATIDGDEPRPGDTFPRDTEVALIAV